MMTRRQMASGWVASQRPALHFLRRKLTLPRPASAGRRAQRQDGTRLRMTTTLALTRKKPRECTDHLDVVWSNRPERRRKSKSVTWRSCSRKVQSRNRREQAWMHIALTCHTRSNSTTMWRLKRNQWIRGLSVQTWTLAGRLRHFHCTKNQPASLTPDLTISTRGWFTIPPTLTSQQMTPTSTQNSVLPSSAKTTTSRTSPKWGRKSSPRSRLGSKRSKTSEGDSRSTSPHQSWVDNAVQRVRPQRARTSRIRWQAWLVTSCGNRCRVRWQVSPAMVKSWDYRKSWTFQVTRMRISCCLMKTSKKLLGKTTQASRYRSRARRWR